MGKKLTQEEFIEKAKLKHGDKYDYSMVEYINWNTKIIIICKEHGEFLQVPNNHLNGRGCFYCSYDNKRGNKIDFVKKSKILHNDKYDYSLVEYKSAIIKVKIICKEHGIFEQVPNSHLNGATCPRCHNNYKIKTTDEFVKRANKKHKYLYDYTEVVFINYNYNVRIICEKHGKFEQTPATHLRGSGCYRCSLSYGKIENEWLDSLNINKRQVRINNYKVDGYDPDTNTIYEFNGDYWHGNPIKYKENDINIISNKTFGELYLKTLEKENKLKELGYNIVSIWESDYLKEKVLS